MKETFKFYFIPLLFLSSLSQAADPVVSKLEKTSPPELIEPAIQEHRFPNGLKLYFLENHELPTFEMNALFEVGTVHEPSQKVGLVSLMVSALATGGSAQHTGDEIDQRLEQVAAHLERKAKGEYSILGLKCLSGDIDLLLPLFFEIVQSPAFERQKIEILRQQMLEEISTRNEKPMNIAARKFLEQLYGKDNVWARLSSKKSVTEITREDIIDFYQKFVAPNNTILVISGDIDFKKLISKIRTLILTWPQKEIQLPVAVPVEKKWTPALYFTPKLTSQSAIVAGHFGEKRFNPDKFKVTLANHILGGLTFGSLLGDRIRTDLGLAYSIDSRFDFNTDYGPFRIFVNTKSQSTAQVAGEIQNILKKLVAGEITEEQLTAARNTILNQLIFQYEDPFDIVNTQALYDFYGYPKHYLQFYQKQIRKVSLEDLKSILQKYFFPDQLMFMVVGDPQVAESLKVLGEIKLLPLDDD